MQVSRVKTQGTTETQRLRLRLVAAEHVERIGARIRKRREELGLSRGKLVEKMQGKVTENDLYRWERGQHRPSDDTLSDLAKALEVDVSYFLVEEPEAATADLLATLSAGTDLHTLAMTLLRAVARLEEQVDRLERHAAVPPDEETN